MMIAGVGLSLKVMGIRIAVPAAGPRPGKTPIRVPKMQPTKAKRRFCRERATEKPIISCCRLSKTDLL